MHAFSLGAFERMHEAAGSRAALSKSALARTTEIAILLNITLPDSTTRAARRALRSLALENDHGHRVLVGVAKSDARRTHVTLLR